MFKNFASDVLGLSDLGKVIDPKDYDKTDVDDYIFTEDGERIFVVIKSKTDEYCFTNLALIHLDGQVATSKKRTLARYPYKNYIISDVSIETAGTIDLDVELKFNIGNKYFSIDIDKKQIDQVRGIYKALFSIASQCEEIQVEMDILKESRASIHKMFLIRELPEAILLNLPDILNQTVGQVESYYLERRAKIRNYDFTTTFQRYIKAVN